jgi:hypothetical protein
MTDSTKTKKRGGKRPGAGRKPVPEGLKPPRAQRRTNRSIWVDDNELKIVKEVLKSRRKG